MSKMRIFTPIIEDSGVSFYRIVQPTQWMTDKKLCYVMSTPYTGSLAIPEISINLLEHGAMWGDIIFTNTAKTEKQFVHFMAMRDWRKKKLVVDVDDNLINLSPDHPAYKSYIDPKLKLSYWVQRSLIYADLVITTHEYLKEFYWPNNQNIFVNPNSINLRKINRIKKAKNKKLTIGWSGAMGHFDNIRLVIEPLKAILKKYKNVEFVYFGQEFKELPGKHIEWVPMSEYYKKFASLGFDISLAPLNDNRYNRGKSNLRLIESSAFKIPIVASPNGPYKDFPCLFATDKKEWFNQMERLILDENLRRECGQKGYDEVKAKYEINVTAPKLFKRFEELIKEPWIPKQIQQSSDIRQSVPTRK